MKRVTLTYEYLKPNEDLFLDVVFGLDEIIAYSQNVCGDYSDIEAREFADGIEFIHGIAGDALEEEFAEDDGFIRFLKDMHIEEAAERGK